MSTERPTSESEYLPISRVAAMAGVSPRTVYTWIHKGLLPARTWVSPGGYTRYSVPRDDAEAFIAEREPVEPRRPRTHPPRPSRDKVHPDAVLAIRRAMAAGADRRDVAKRYGVSVSAIDSIQYGRTWKAIGGPIGTPAPRAALSDAEVRQIREEHQRGATQTDLARKWRRSVGWVNAVVRGRKRVAAGGPIAQSGRPRIPDEDIRGMRWAYHCPPDPSKRPTHSQLADRYGISHGYVCKLLRGEARREASGPMPSATEAGTE